MPHAANRSSHLGGVGTLPKVHITWTLYGSDCMELGGRIPCEAKDAYRCTYGQLDLKTAVLKLAERPQLFSRKQRHHSLNGRTAAMLIKSLMHMRRSVNRQVEAPHSACSQSDLAPRSVHPNASWKLE